MTSPDYVMVPREIVDRFPEINLANYDDDEVRDLNNWGIEIVSVAPPSPRSDDGSGLTPHSTAVSAALRAQVIEECAKVVAPSGDRPCDCTGCYCGNRDDAARVAAWDADNQAAAAIRTLSVKPAVASEGASPEAVKPAVSAIAQERDVIDIVFDGPPGHEAGRFVEIESPPGRSVRYGEWIMRENGYWVLRIDFPSLLLMARGALSLIAKDAPESEPKVYDEYGGFVRSGNADDCAYDLAEHARWELAEIAREALRTTSPSAIDEVGGV